MADPIPIYRFLDSIAAKNTIEMGAFRVGRLSNFNDPFEWQPGGTGTTLEEQQYLDYVRANIIPLMESRMGVLCFSASISAPILWSLYAEKHQGVAFELKYAWGPDDLHKMEYSDHRPLLDFARLRKVRNEVERDKYLKSLIKRLMRRKSKSWSFENEHRTFIDLNDAKYCRASGKWHEWLFPKHILTRVILGIRCLLAEQTVRQLLDKSGFVHTRIVRAMMCSENYAVVA